MIIFAITLSMKPRFPCYMVTVALPTAITRLPHAVLQHDRDAVIKHCAAFDDLIVPMHWATRPIAETRIAAGINRHAAANFSDLTAVAGGINAYRRGRSTLPEYAFDCPAENFHLISGAHAYPF